MSITSALFGQEILSTRTKRERERSMSHELPPFWGFGAFTQSMTDWWGQLKSNPEWNASGNSHLVEYDVS